MVLLIKSLKRELLLQFLGVGKNSGKSTYMIMSDSWFVFIGK